ncbi:MAG TPA: hypothetical protein VFE23_14600 [Usitatibacter sp.]|jgi:hypothetical protein|nr:hypothetical protein [Usitatibacter sp.]
MDEKAPYLPHAPSIVSITAIGVGVGIMVGGIALALAGAWTVSRFVPSPVNAPNNADRPRIMGAVQRTAPPLELDAFLREKNERLHGRGVDRQTGEAFIPIEEAMKTMAAGQGTR